MVGIHPNGNSTKELHQIKGSLAYIKLIEIIKGHRKVSWRIVYQVIKKGDNAELLQMEEKDGKQICSTYRNKKARSEYIGL